MIRIINNGILSLYSFILTNECLFEEIMSRSHELTKYYSKYENGYETKKNYYFNFCFLPGT